MMPLAHVTILVTVSLSALILAECASAEPATTSPTVQETKEQHDQRMAWWREARFGMFIHWGVYSVPAGTTAANR